MPRRRKKVKLIAYDGVAGPREFKRLERAVAEAQLRVPIAAIYPLAQAAKAHERLKKGHVLGPSRAIDSPPASSKGPI